MLVGIPEVFHRYISGASYFSWERKVLKLMTENNLADSLVASDDDFDNDGDFDDEEVEAKTNQQTNRKSNAMKSGIF